MTPAPTRSQLVQNGTWLIGSVTPSIGRRTLRFVLSSRCQTRLMTPAPTGQHSPTSSCCGPMPRTCSRTPTTTATSCGRRLWGCVGSPNSTPRSATPAISGCWPTRSTCRSCVGSPTLLCWGLGNSPKARPARRAAATLDVGRSAARGGAAR